MMGISRKARNWPSVAAPMFAAAVLAMAACAAVMPASAPVKTPDAKAIHATPAPQYYPSAPIIPRPMGILDTTYLADVVAHVKLKSARSEVQQEVKQIDGASIYRHRPVIWYEFEALEYVKGNGGNTIWGLVYVGHSAQSEEAARELAAQYVQLIDPLHTGAAIVFMRESDASLPHTQQKDHYSLGRFIIDYHSDPGGTNPMEGYSLAYYRRWLPLASSDGVSGASEEARFILRHPNGSYAGGYPEDWSNAPEEILTAAGSPVISAIGLSDLRYIAENERSLLEQRGYYIDLGRGEPRVSRVGMAARNLTAEVVGDAVVLRWNVETSPSALGGVKGYRVFRQSSVEGNRDFSALGRVESELVKLADVEPASSSMSYEDKAGVSPGATYIYRVWALEEDVYVFGEYGAEARLAIVATDGATAKGAVVPVPTYY